MQTQIMELPVSKYNDCLDNAILVCCEVLGIRQEDLICRFPPMVVCSNTKEDPRLMMSNKIYYNDGTPDGLLIYELDLYLDGEEIRIDGVCHLTEENLKNCDDHKSRC